MSDVIPHSNPSRDFGDTPIGNAVQLRERMRAIIQAEVDRIDPTDDARRALELIIESSLRPSSLDGDLKLTVVDASGQPRMIEKNGEMVPFTLSDLIAELRTLHPVLFKSPPRPQPIAVETGPVSPGREARPLERRPERDWLALGAGEPAKGDLPHPSRRTRTLTRWTKGKVRFHSWSTRRAARAPTAEAPMATPLADVRKSLAASADRAQAFFDNLQDNLQDRPISRRPGFALGAVAAVLVLIGLGAFLLLRPESSMQASADDPSETGSLTANQVAKAPAFASRSSGGRTLKGVPDVIDTATLSLEGEVVRLFGVEWAPGAGKPEDLSNYLQGREVTCEPAGGADTYRCRVGEQDLSRVILFNGGGQPTSEATPELKAAAEHARAAKIGVWSSRP